MVPISLALTQYRRFSRAGLSSHEDNCSFQSCSGPWFNCGDFQLQKNPRTEGQSIFLMYPHNTHSLSFSLKPPSCLSGQIQFLTGPSLPLKDYQVVTQEGEREWASNWLIFPQDKGRGMEGVCGREGTVNIRASTVVLHLTQRDTFNKLEQSGP